MKLSDIQYPQTWVINMLRIMSKTVGREDFSFSGVNLDNRPICKWTVKLKTK